MHLKVLIKFIGHTSGYFTFLPVIFVQFSFVALLVLSLSPLSCHSDQNTGEQKSWDLLIKDLEIVMISPGPDSVKAAQVTEILKKYNITPGEYHKFYESMLLETVTQNIDLLKKVEKAISEDMSARARTERQLYDKQIVTPRRADSTRLKKDARE